jgi:hypothetical protein
MRKLIFVLLSLASRSVFARTEVVNTLNCDGVEYAAYYNVPHSRAYSPGYILVNGEQFFLSVSVTADHYLATPWEKGADVPEIGRQLYCGVTSYRSY